MPHLPLALWARAVSLLSAGPASVPMPARGVPLWDLIVFLLCNVECWDETGDHCGDFYIKH